MTIPMREFQKITRKYAQEHRAHPTPSATHFWDQVRTSDLGVRVRRERLVGPYIADFWIGMPHRICIEIDGAYHAKQNNYDARRDESMRRRGVRVLRFTNEQVLNDWPAVLALIKNTIAQPRPALQP